MSYSKKVQKVTLYSVTFSHYDTCVLRLTVGSPFRSYQYFNLPVPLSHHNFCPFLTSGVLLRAPAREGHQEPLLNSSIFQFLMSVNVWVHCQPVPPWNSGRTSDCVHQAGTDTSRSSFSVMIASVVMIGVNFFFRGETALRIFLVERNN